MDEWLTEQFEANRKVIRLALAGCNAKGQKIHPTTAVSLRHHTNRDQCIIKLLRELLIFMPKEFALSEKAEQGFRFLCDKQVKTFQK
jgi:hypothetical protein